MPTQRPMTEAEKNLFLEQATKQGLRIYQKSSDDPQGQSRSYIIVRDPKDPQYMGYFERRGIDYVYWESKDGKLGKFAYDSDSVTEGRTMDEVTKEIKAAHRCIAPEEIIVEPGAKLPGRLQESEDAPVEGKEKKHNKEGVQEPPTPTKKSSAEMGQSPKDFLGDDIDLIDEDELTDATGYRVDEIYVDDQGTKTKTPKTMSAVCKQIRNA